MSTSGSDSGSGSITKNTFYENKDEENDIFKICVISIGISIIIVLFGIVIFRKYRKSTSTEIYRATRNYSFGSDHSYMYNSDDGNESDSSYLSHSL